MVYICGQEGCAGLVGQQKSVKCNPKCKEQKKTKKTQGAGRGKSDD